MRFRNPPHIVSCIVALVGATLFASASAARADGFPEPASKRSYRPYPPVEITSLIFESPRPLRVWTARIDTSTPEVEILNTCRGNVAGALETECATTLEFAQSNGAQVAINASPFSPFRQNTGEGMDIVGLAACDGQVFSQPDDRFGALVVTRDNRVDIWSPPIAEDRLAQVRSAVGGFRILVEKGRSVAEKAAAASGEKFAGVNPRTAVGVSADRNTLWFIIVDGRNPGRSEGMTLIELADFGLALGCDALLNLDGGGSTTLVVQDPASREHRVVNEPVGRGPVGTLRLVGNNLGVRIRTPSADNTHTPAQGQKAP